MIEIMFLRMCFYLWLLENILCTYLTCIHLWWCGGGSDRNLAFCSWFFMYSEQDIIYYWIQDKLCCCWFCGLFYFILVKSMLCQFLLAGGSLRWSVASYTRLESTLECSPNWPYSHELPTSIWVRKYFYIILL